MTNSVSNFALTLGLPIGMAWIACTHRRRLLAAARNPAGAQRSLLRRILTENAATRFGQEHGFSSIGSFVEYQKRVPVQTYESLRHRIDRQAATGEPALTMKAPLCYARTSGTTGSPKDIPVTSSMKAANKAAQKLMAFTLYRDTEFFGGEILGINGAAIEGIRDDGAAYGAASGHAHASLSPLIRPKFPLPDALFGMTDYEAKYYATALYGLSSPRLTGIATANPSTLLKLEHVLSDHRGALVEDLEGGHSIMKRALPEGLRAAVGERIRANPDASGRAAAMLARGVALRDLLPDLATVVTWTGGSCGVALEDLRPALPARCRIVELGYRASELTGTVNVDASRNTCLPLLNEVVFEFASREDWEADRNRFLTLEELDIGALYYVFVTTRDGLYRYAMNDILRVTGRVHNAPALEFVRKGRGVTNITGEKLCEEQVLSAIKGKLGGDRFVVMLGDERRAQYTIYVESAQPCARQLRHRAEEIDRALRRANLEYDAKRGSGRLAKLQIDPLRPGAWEHCKCHAVQRGQRETQYKPVCLTLTRDWPIDLSLFSTRENAA